MDILSEPTSALSRIKSIDIAKGIGILLVVLSHTNHTEPLSTLVYSVHMPLFFIISGMMFNPEKYKTVKSLLKKRFITMICPYVLINFFAVLLFVGTKVLNGTVSGAPLIFKTLGYNFSQIFIASTSHTMEFNVPTWFVMTLLLVEVIYYFICKCKNNIVKFIIVLAIVVAGFFTSFETFPVDLTKYLPWNFSAALFSLGFYYLGNISFNYIKKYLSRDKEIENRTLILILSVPIATALWLPSAMLNGKITIGSQSYGTGILLYASGVFGTVIILAIASLIGKCSFLEYCGKNSLYIMATHKVVQNYTQPYIEAAYKSVFKQEAGVWMKTLIMLVFCTAVSLLFTLLYTRFIKPLFRKIQGNVSKA